MTKDGAAFLLIRNCPAFGLLNVRISLIYQTALSHQILETCSTEAAKDVDSMTSIQQSSMERTRKAIIEHGFFFEHDAALGHLVDVMDKDGVPFASAGGLEFCKISVLDNPVSRTTLLSTLRNAYCRSASGLFLSPSSTGLL